VASDADLDVLEKRKAPFSLLGSKLRFVGRPSNGLVTLLTEG